MDFKFSSGQCVQYTPTGSVAGRYIVLKAQPLESHQSEPMYRIRGELAGEERIVTECNLSDDVGTVQDYALAASARVSLRKR